MQAFPVNDQRTARLAISGVTGNTQVAIDTVSMANNDGTTFRPLSVNVVTLRYAAAPMPWSRSGRMPSTLTAAARLAEIAGPLRACSDQCLSRIHR